MRYSLIFTGLLLFAAVNAAAQTIVIYDPLVKSPSEKPYSAEKKLVQRYALPAARSRFGDESGCDGSDLRIVGVSNGSFTRSGAKQKAVVYELCQVGNGMARNGIAIFEAGKPIAHFTESGGWNTEVKTIADINKNGRSELYIETSGGMHQGYTGTSVTLYEIDASAVKSLGTFINYTNECGAEEDGDFCDRALKITANAGRVPKFFEQEFENTSKTDVPRWSPAGTRKAAKVIVAEEAFNREKI